MPKRWEFGSQIHWLRFTPNHAAEPIPWEQNGVLSGSGRDALRLVLQDQRWKRLWTPSYFCPDVLRALLRCPIELVCYKDSPLEPAPNLQCIPFREGDTILIVNYFGLRRPEDIKVPSGVGVIEDHTHGPLSRWAYESNADFCFASLRKIFPLPDGGVAWSPRGHQIPRLTELTADLQAASSARLSAMLLKTLYLEGHSIEKGVFLDLSTRGEDWFDGDAISAMTPLSKHTLRILPFRRWEESRRATFWMFADALITAKGFRVLLPADPQAVPFCVPFVFEDRNVRVGVGERLIQQSIYPTRLWPLDDFALEGTPDEHRLLSQRMFVLPCDARYSPDDVQRVIDAIREEGLLVDQSGKEIPAIPKTPLKEDSFVLRRIFTRSALTGFGHLLRHACPPGRRVLLPAYVGRSRSGSGVLDPIEACGLPYAFYAVGANLQADLRDLRSRLQEKSVFAMVVIHYFGIPQPEIKAIRRLCDEQGALLIEDCAHIPDCRFGKDAPGNIGDASYYSISNCLPAEDGGILQINNDSLYVPPLEAGAECSASTLESFCRADWAGIAERRKSNYRRLAELILPVNNVTLMFPRLDDHTTPLNLPVLIECADRFSVYRGMREKGIGVTALYHTLVDAISPSEFPVSHDLSRRILNLPVHQDIEPPDLSHVADTLDRIVNEKK